ncbi:hypothetical protein D3P09_23030 [Paenibacillus pinisoli]|uniref:N-acetyltransferase domain-containing protein n=1 Tax=Paenibacillus pinisoli TaxID=1276110 RepID=A0A3A6PC03_9BACL|nr:GNAT family N-acetyltransferase [Paenibacillus pinisoli]RJX37236.1 hypothetical protein D3P09_23030 [Paenibacillus pinisoli]
MIRAATKLCERDSDYARFARFYLTYSRQFRRNYTIEIAAAHILMTLPTSYIFMYENESGEFIGFVQYYYEPDRHTAFIDSAILMEEYRSSRVFYEGIRDLVRHICSKYPTVRRIRFHALAENRYLNRLYGKFADRIGERDNGGDPEYIYSSEVSRLKAYLRLES